MNKPSKRPNQFQRTMMRMEKAGAVRRDGKSTSVELGVMSEQDFRAAVSKQCGFPLQLKDRHQFVTDPNVDPNCESCDECGEPKSHHEPTDAEVLSALQFALNDEDHQLECEDQEREENEIPYSLRDEGRDSNGMGESYAERNL